MECDRISIEFAKTIKDRGVFGSMPAMSGETAFSRDWNVVFCVEMACMLLCEL